MAGEPDLDPGPQVWGEVEFVEVHHEELGTSTHISPDLLEHYGQRGWKPTDSAPVVEDLPKSTPPKRRSARTQES